MKKILEFGIKRKNEERRDGGCAVIFDPDSQLYAVGKCDDGSIRLFSGGVNDNEDIQNGTLREVIEESGLCDFLHVENIDTVFTHYYNSLRKVNRVAKATCFLIILKSSKTIPVKLEEHETFSLDWMSALDIVKHWQLNNKNKGCDHWIYFLKKSVVRAKELNFDTTSKI